MAFDHHISVDLPGAPGCVFGLRRNIIRQLERETHIMTPEQIIERMRIRHKVERMQAQSRVLHDLALDMLCRDKSARWAKPVSIEAGKLDLEIAALMDRYFSGQVV